MESLKHLYKIGRGPSSSHSMAPQKAARRFLQRYAQADAFRVLLFGSLSDTGKGHGTDNAIREIFDPLPCEIVFAGWPETPLPHENTMDFYALQKGEPIGYTRFLSIGGGEIAEIGQPRREHRQLYAENSFSEIAALCASRNIRLSDYVFEHEDPDFPAYLRTIWQTMQQTILAGLTTCGVLPGGLGVERKAQLLLQQTHIDESATTRENRLVCAYAFAVGEQNAAGGTVVTAPTCGASAVVPSVLKYMQETRSFSEEQILRALAVGGLIGNLCKTNASISGAECGCQAEIGTACSMAAAALCELFGMGLGQIEYAAEIAMEHMLGLTCDPVCGLVQIPCIERNAVAAMRAINALSLANFLSGTRRVSFDAVVETMYRTGKDLRAAYRETAKGGLAQVVPQIKEPNITK